MDGQTEGPTDIEIDRQTDRPTDRHKKFTMWLTDTIQDTKLNATQFHNKH